MWLSILAIRSLLKVNASRDLIPPHQEPVTEPQTEPNHYTSGPQENNTNRAGMEVSAFACLEPLLFF